MVTEPDSALVFSLSDEALQQVVLRELLLSEVGNAHSQLLLRLIGKPIGDAQGQAAHHSNGTHALAVAHTEQTDSAALPDRSVPVFSPEMIELRRILLAPEHARIAQLEAEIAQLQQQLMSQDALIEILSPVIANSIANRVRDSRDEMVEAFYPIIGSSITRAVNEAIRNLAERIDATVRQNLRPQMAKRLWLRLQGVNPQEAMLRDVLPFTVQEIFLIHRRSGLLLHHASATGTITDADLISGMLTAIRSYVRDSLGGDEEQTLDEINYGERQIVIQEGSAALLAVVLEGIEPADFRQRMREQLSVIHAAFGSQIRDYQGDPLDPETLHELLAPLLATQDTIS